MQQSLDRFRRWCSLLPAALGLLFAGTPVSRGAESPLDGTILLNGELTREYQLEAGGQVEGRLVLSNPGGVAGRVRIYQTDYTFTADGRTDYGAPGGVPRSNAPWVEVDEHEPELQPGETRAVPFKVTVPANPALSGTYWSMLMVEPAAPPPAPEAKTGIRIRSISRYGVQIVVQVGTKAQARPVISGQAIIAESGHRQLSFDLTNEGTRWLRPKVEVRLFDGTGRALKVLPGRASRVYPGTSVRHTVELTNLPTGDYLAFIVLDSGDETFGAQYRFRLD